ncbi:histidine phosphatase superfamily [Tribonema minus]|uniref:Histidine phosphatase superfamily n=1 Tax=Tribonema minus TaxID=303371 RepID=A0A835YVR7_9STRA|nr:histidine phosphatase superfamily [Tribonema minus]
MAIAAQNQRNDAPFKTQLKPVLQLEGLDELSWGWMEGEPKDLEPVKTPLKQLLGAWASGNYTAAAEGGESAQAVFDRSQSALSQVLKHGHRHNLVVTHGRTMRILLLGLAGLPISDMDAFGSVPNTGVYVFAVKDGQYEMLFPQVNSCQSEEDQEEERAICQNAPQSE